MLGRGVKCSSWRVLLETEKEETGLACACQSGKGEWYLKARINIYFLEIAYTCHLSTNADIRFCLDLLMVIVAVRWVKRTQGQSQECS